MRPTGEQGSGMAPRPPMAPVEAIAALSGGALASLRDALRRAGFADAIADEAESIAPGMLDAVRQPAVEWRLRRAGSPAAMLTLLFLYSGRVQREVVAAVLGAPLLDVLVGAGVLVEDASGLASPFRLTPLQGLYFLHDPFEAGRETAMGPSLTTLALARLIPASPGAVLDVGCGAGTLALLAAARGARRAVGVDLSERAVTLARVNARLNGLDAEFRCGDLLAPVRGEAFDLVLSQPPYVVTPPGLAPTTFLHGGARGDELPLRFAAAFPEALAEGGRAVLFFDTPRGGEPLHRRLRAALGEARVSLAVLDGTGPSAELAAMGYGSLEDPTLGPRYRETVAHYRDHMASLGARGFARAMAVLVRPSGADAGFTVELPVADFAGIDVAALARWLGGLALVGGPDEALLDAAVGPAPGAHLAEVRDLAPGSEPTRTLRFPGGGIPKEFELSEAGEALLLSLAGAPSVRHAEAAFAEACGRTPEAVREVVLRFVRDGLSRGILAAAGRPSA